MTREIMPDESEALDRSGALLKFAAENTKDLDPKVVSTICASWDAKNDNTWDQKIATDFWVAFHSLSDSIKPVTIDTLSTNLPEIPPPRKLWGKYALSRRVADYYYSGLFCLLLLAVILSFVVSALNKQTSELQKLIDSGNQFTDKVNSAIDSLEPLIKNKEFSTVGPDHRGDIVTLQKNIQELYHVWDTILAKNEFSAHFMHRLSFGATKEKPFEPGLFQPPADIKSLRKEVIDYYLTRSYTESSIMRGSFIVDLICSVFFPLLFGFMGAGAYIVRYITEQIRASTFSTTSSVRHRVRFLLGGLAGVVIGFGVFANTNNISPSALAFIAGYAVEPVFATFDSIAEKFNRKNWISSGGSRGEGDTGGAGN